MTRMGSGVARLMAASVWAMERTRLDALWAFAREASRTGADPPTIAAAMTSETRAMGTSAVVMIPVMGELWPRENLFTYFFGGASVERIRAQVRTALADETVKAIVLKFDSPGGLVDGIPEFAAELFAARGTKPIVSMIDAGACASAAYWLAANTEAISMSSSSQVGSIGILSIHESYARMLEEEGIDVTIIRSAPTKADGLPHEPLSDEARADLQAKVDERAGQFRADVARGRGVTTKVVQETFGEGKVFFAKEAKAIGMVDRIETCDQLIARLSGTKARAGLRADVGDDARDGLDLSAPILRRYLDDARASTPAASDDDGPDVARADADYLTTRIAIAKARA